MWKLEKREIFGLGLFINCLKSSRAVLPMVCCILTLQREVCHQSEKLRYLSNLCIFLHSHSLTQGGKPILASDQGLSVPVYPNAGAKITAPSAFRLPKATLRTK
jgi:hypothetical protein